MNNDKLLMENMLLLLKSTTEVYVHGTLESFNEPTHKTLKNNLDETLKLQDEVYNKMTECGWYTISNVEAKEIAKTIKKLKNK